MPVSLARISDGGKKWRGLGGGNFLPASRSRSPAAKRRGGAAFFFSKIFLKKISENKESGEKGKIEDENLPE